MRIDGLNSFVKNNQACAAAVSSAKSFLNNSRIKLEHVTCRQLKDDKIALLVNHPPKSLTTNSQRTTLFIFGKDNSLIEKTYSLLLDTGRKIFSTTTNFYRNGNPFSSSWVVKLFKDGKLLSSYPSNKCLK